ncbi:MAG: chemotaxis protein CheW, partial [Pseudomonadota bacterium]|nr:chemotaxis protein CheW [Pseudomonadota bacterium]
MNLEDEEVKPAPEFGVAFDSKYLHGLATLEDHMVIIVDIEALISRDELGLFVTA